MNNWNQYLTSLGARSSGAEPGALIADFGRTLSAADLAAGFVAILTDQDLIAVRGDDAASFLHSQLTNDVEHLDATQVRLAAYCTPKGRMQASLLMWRDAEAVYLQLPAELRPALQKRLSMFVMRAKAKLEDATAAEANQVVLGLGGQAAQAALAQHFNVLPATPYSKIDHAYGTLLRVGDAFGAPRYLWLTSGDTALPALPVLAANLAVGGNAAWALSSIHAGVPHITARTQEQFVPQMVNYELLNGINFKKGCYPGQEIVARSQYLGKLKRRTTMAAIDSLNAAAGDEVFDLADPDQPCGMVVNAAPNGLGGSDALVELKLASIDQGDVRLGSASGPALRFMAMPYALDALDL
jgi:folate-binding protein YgfZ